MPGDETTDPSIAEPSGAFPRPSSIPISIDLHKIVSGAMGAVLLALGGWVWDTNQQLIELKIKAETHATAVQMSEIVAVQNDIRNKVDIMYDRIVLNPR